MTEYKFRGYDKVGDKIRFAEEKKPYTIRACDDRFLVCTKPYNFRPKTMLYIINRRCDPNDYDEE